MLLFSCLVVSSSFATPLTIACQAPLSTRVPRQKDWSGLPFPSSGDLSQPRDRTHISCIGRWILYHGPLESESESELTQSCPTLFDPMNCSLPGSSVNGILQARILEWVAISFSNGPLGMPLKVIVAY